MDADSFGDVTLQIVGTDAKQTAVDIRGDRSSLDPPTHCRHRAVELARNVGEPQEGCHAASSQHSRQVFEWLTNSYLSHHAQ